MSAVELPSKGQSHLDHLALCAVLEEKLLARKSFDERWGKRNFLLAQLFMWISILASFFSAIAIASGKVDWLVTTILAAMPGTAMVIERSFSFAKRTRWNWEMIVGLEALHNRLVFEGVSIEEVSREYSLFRKSMEAKYPGFSVERLDG